MRSASLDRLQANTDRTARAEQRARAKALFEREQATRLRLAPTPRRVDVSPAVVEPPPSLTWEEAMRLQEEHDIRMSSSEGSGDDRSSPRPTRARHQPGPVAAEPHPPVQPEQPAPAVVRPPPTRNPTRTPSPATRPVTAVAMPMPKVARHTPVASPTPGGTGVQPPAQRARLDPGRTLLQTAFQAGPHANTHQRMGVRVADSPERVHVASSGGRGPEPTRHTRTRSPSPPRQPSSPEPFSLSDDGSNADSKDDPLWPPGIADPPIQPPTATYVYSDDSSSDFTAPTSQHTHRTGPTPTALPVAHVPLHLDAPKPPKLDSIDAGVVARFLREERDYQLSMLGRQLVPLRLRDMLSRRVKDGAASIALTWGLSLPRDTTQRSPDGLRVDGVHDPYLWDAVFRRLLVMASEETRRDMTKSFEAYDRDIRTSVRMTRHGEWRNMVAAFMMDWNNFLIERKIEHIFNCTEGEKHAIKLLSELVQPNAMRDIATAQRKQLGIKRLDQWFQMLISLTDHWNGVRATMDARAPTHFKPDFSSRRDRYDDRRQPRHQPMGGAGGPDYRDRHSRPLGFAHHHPKANVIVTDTDRTRRTPRKPGSTKPRPSARDRSEPPKDGCLGCHGRHWLDQCPRLTPEQRKQVLDKFRAQRKSHSPRGGAMVASCTNDDDDSDWYTPPTSDSDSDGSTDTDSPQHSADSAPSSSTSDEPSSSTTNGPDTDGSPRAALVREPPSHEYTCDGTLTLFSDKIPFTLDTGATHNFISLNTARAILPPSRKLHPMSKPFTLSTAGEGRLLRATHFFEAPVHLDMDNGERSLTSLRFYTVSGFTDDLALIGRTTLKRRFGIDLAQQLIDAHDNHDDDDVPWSDERTAQFAAAMLGSADPVDTEHLAAEVQQFDDAQPNLAKHDPTIVMDKLRVKLEEMSMQLNEQCTTPEEHTAVRTFVTQVVTEFADVFREKLSIEEHVPIIPGMEDGVKVDVDNERFKRLRMQRRTYPKPISDMLEVFMRTLEQCGYIERAPFVTFASPVFAVRKPDAPLHGDPSVTHRATVDLRQVNSVTAKGITPIPRIPILRTYLNGVKYFGKLDLNNGFWQLPLHPSCREYFALMTDRGTWIPNRLIQGSKNASGPFHQAISAVLDGLLYVACLLYVDDILIIGRSIKEFLSNWIAVLQRLKQSHIKASVNKTTFHAEWLPYCGRLIGAKGVRFNDKFVDTIAHMSPPSTAAGLRQLLGMTNWMRDAIPYYNELKQPIQDLLATALAHAKERGLKNLDSIKLTEIGWSTQHDEVFLQLKRSLVSYVTLAHPESGPEWETAVACDASDIGYGSVIVQYRKDEADLPLMARSVRPLAFFSGTFAGAQKRWATVDKEAYAIKETLVQGRHLLECVESFVILTDHRNLSFIFHPELERTNVSRVTSDKLQRWRLIIDGFRYRIVHIPGTDNVAADVLSRWGRPKQLINVEVNGVSPASAHSHDDDNNTDSARATAAADTATALYNTRFAASRRPITTPTRLSRPARKAKATKSVTFNDTPIIVTLPSTLSDSTPASPSSSSLATPSTSVAPSSSALRDRNRTTPASTPAPVDSPAITEQTIINAQRDPRLGYADKLVRTLKLTQRDDGAWIHASGRLFVPQLDNLQQLVIAAAHNGPAAHRGSDATYTHLAEYCWWPSMKDDVRRHCLACMTCLKTRTGKTVPRPLLHMQRSPGPNKLISFDFAQARSDQLEPGATKYVLVILDNFSRFVRLYPATNTDAATVTTALMDWFSSYGICLHWTSDQGSHFCNDVMKRLAEVYGADHHFTAAYAPWSNGAVERVNRTLHEMLSAVMIERKSTDDTWVSYLPVVNHALNNLPSDALAGHTPFEAFLGHCSVNPLVTVFTSDFPRLVPINSDHVQRAVSRLRDALDAIHAKVNAVTDKRRRSPSPASITLEICVGDEVLVARDAIAAEKGRDKTVPRWYGPFTVTSVRNLRTFEVTDNSTGAVHVVHARFLRKCSIALQGRPSAMLMSASPAAPRMLDELPSAPITVINNHLFEYSAHTDSVELYASVTCDDGFDYVGHYWLVVAEQPSLWDVYMLNLQVRDITTWVRLYNWIGSHRARLAVQKEVV